jgi:prophage regulatory protein
MFHMVQKGTDMADRHLRRPAVEQLTGLSRSTIYDLMTKGEFPRSVRLTARAVAWPESAIAEWLAQRPKSA